MFEIDWSINNVTIMLDIHLGRALALTPEWPEREDLSLLLKASRCVTDTEAQDN